MKVVKNMCRLGLVLLVLTSTAAASAEGGLYWAYADAITLYPNEDWHKYPYAYGAAWNFPSLEEAEEAAVEACRRQVSDPQGCHVTKTDKNSCFGVIKSVINYGKRWGTVTRFDPTWGYPSRAEAQAGTERYAAEDPHNMNVVPSTVEMVECAGVE